MISHELQPSRHARPLPQVRDEGRMSRMRRVARYTLTALTALSMLLCVATCVMWVRSYSMWDCITYDRKRTYSTGHADDAYLTTASGCGGVELGAGSEGYVPSVLGSLESDEGHW